jgi:hypothetical protein
MRKLFSILLITALFMVVSCGGGSKDSGGSCPDGYHWSGTDCEKDGSGDTGDTGTVTDTDTPADDSDTADDTEPDEDADTEVNDGETSDYTGECTEIRSGDDYEINVETKKLTVGEIKINGAATGDDAYGEIWAENKGTLDEFKVGDVAGLSGKTMNFPKGRYNFAYRPVSSANKVVIAENIDLSSGDRTLDFDLPLYHLKGKVVNNSDAVFTVEEAYLDSTQLVLKTGTFEKVIPYSEFASYDILLPKGTYSVSFKGQLAAGQESFDGTVLPSSKGIVVEDDMDKDIKIETITFAGSIVQEGYAVSGGQLVLVENPPLSSISAVVVADLSSATSYSIAVTTGADLNLVYLPEAGSYPVRYIKLETWNAGTADPSGHNITLDFGRVYGKIKFLGGNDFPTVTKCTEADCTIGKLKAVGFDASSFVIKDFGTDLVPDDEGNITYEGLLVRRLSITDAEGNVQYSQKTYSMNFESYLNDVSGIFSGLPFTVPATYANSEGAQVSSFSFAVMQADNTTTWLTEKEMDLNVAPSRVSGKITLNGSTFQTEKADFIRIKDENGIEYPVLNISELSGGEFSFYAPVGTYDVIYDGQSIISADFKTFIERDLEIGDGDNSHNFDIKTGKVTLDFNVNGTPFAEWVEKQKAIESIGLAVNIDKTASDFVLDLSKKDGKYIAEVLLGSTINAYLELAFVDKVASERSYTRVPLLSSHNMTSGTTVKNDLTLIDFNMSVKLNGKAVKASEYAAKLRLQGSNSSEIYCPAEGSVGAFFKKGEYKTPAPELYLNEGFDTKQGIALDCIYFGE